MKIFHYDRTGSLSEGMVMEPYHDYKAMLSHYGGLDQFHPDPESLLRQLFPDGLSRHGMFYLGVSRHPVTMFSVVLPITENSQPMPKGMLQLSEIESVSHFAGTVALEMTLELLRRNVFPQEPSRFQSLFCLRNIDDLQYWPEMRNPQTHQFDGKLFEIEIDDVDVSVFDAAHLYPGLISCQEQHVEDYRSYCFDFAPLEEYVSAYSYWAKLPAKSPQPECLVQLPVTLGKEVQFLPDTYLVKSGPSVNGVFGESQ
jgi:hypothetical protein